MPSPLLRTKFLAPTYNPNSVSRAELQERLRHRGGRKLVMISAPAGFGKTTLVSQWIHSQEQPFCWLSLDEHDADNDRFWRYFIGSVATWIENFGEEATEFLSASQYEAAATSLINELTEWTLSGQALNIVLDDFHVIDNPETLKSFAYFIDFLPPNVEIILTTRFEPELPISRWAVKNWLDSIYSSDLSFSVEEAKDFFRQTMSLDLPDEQIEDIHTKTGGWIAAMQLSALSVAGARGLQQAQLPTSKLLHDDEHLSEYVVNEILEHQPEDLREFMLDSACVLRLNHKLLDSIRDRDNSQEMLQAMYSKNLFIIPLDKENEWFRYHEIFRNALLTRQKAKDASRIETLQKRTVDWLIEHSLAHEAIEQTVALKDFELLASLIESNGNNLIHEGHHLPILRWLSFLPDTLIYSSPRLLMVKIWGLFFSNKIEVIEPYLDELEILIDKQRLDNIETSTNELIDLHSEISLIRSYIARSHSDLSSASELTKQVLKELDHTNMPLKSVTYYGIGLDSFTVGDLESAASALNAAIEHGRREKKYTTVLSSSGLLGWINFYRGHLQSALDTGIQSQQWIDSHYDASQPRIISCWQNSGLAMIYMQRAEYTIAQSYINPLLKHIQAGTEPGLHILIQYTQAYYQFSQHNFVEAIACLEDAELVYAQKKDSVVFTPPSLSALKARCLMAIGKLEKAEQLLNGLDTETITQVPLNFEDINLTRMRLLIEQQRYTIALGIGKRLIEQTLEKNHTFHYIQALTLKGLALMKAGEKARARDCINQSLEHASREGFVALYSNESDDVSKLLGLSNSASISDHFLHQLSEAIGLRKDNTPKPNELPGAAAFENNRQLLEPLSQRELEVLKLIDQGLANKEIASKLSLAPATVKAHIRNLYGKIAAKSRTEALSKARQFGLI